MTWITLDAQIAPLVALAASLFALCVDLRRRVGRHRRRTRDLRTCAELLDQHQASLEKFIQSPDAPTQLKSALLNFSEVTSDREKAHSVVAAMCSGEVRTQRDAEAARSINKALESLRASHPELAQDFDTAVSSAAAAMLFRWAETADLFRDYVTKVITDSRKGKDLFVRAARLGTSRSSDDASEVSFGPAMPAH